MAKTISFHPVVDADLQATLALNMAEPFEAQVREHLKGLGDLTGADVIALHGQAVAAIISLPILEMACGLPHNISIVGFGKEAKVESTVDFDQFRHNGVRPRRANVPEGQAFAGWTVLDGAGRGLTPVQFIELATALGRNETDIRVIDVNPGQVDLKAPTVGQAERLVQTGLTKADWTSSRLLYLPAGHGGVAALQATAIYGLAEVWPRVIRLNREADGAFHVAEVVDPQSGRQFGVQLKAAWSAANAPVLVPRDLLRQAAEALRQGGNEDLAAALEAAAR